MMVLHNELGKQQQVGLMPRRHGKTKQTAANTKQSLTGLKPERKFNLSNGVLGRLNDRLESIAGSETNIVEPTNISIFVSKLLDTKLTAGLKNNLSVFWSVDYDSCYVIDKHKGCVRMISF